MKRSTNQRILWALGVVSIIVGVLCVTGAALLQALVDLLMSASPESPAWTNFDFSQMPDVEAGITIICVVLAAAGLVDIGVGVFGMRTANGDAHGIGCLVLCGISLAIDLAMLSLGITDGVGAAGLMVLVALVAVFCWRVRREMGGVSETP